MSNTSDNYTIMSNTSDNINNDYLQFECDMHVENHTGALNSLDKIIKDLKARYENSNNQLDKTSLVVFVLKRIKLNFPQKNFKDVADDCSLLKQLGEDLTTNKEIFLMNEQSVFEVFLNDANNRFKLAQIKYIGDVDINSIALKYKALNPREIFKRAEGNKSTTKKQKVC